jgi:hypothetical protein
MMKHAFGVLSFASNNLPALHPCEMPWYGHGFHKKAVKI